MVRGPRIAIKSDVGRMPGLLAAGFDTFEVYVGDETWLDRCPPAAAKICAVHQPGVVRLDGRRVGANLCDRGAVGERSAEVLAEVIGYAARHGAAKVVVHPGYFDALTDTRAQALDILAGRLCALRHPAVTICVENITRWSNALFRREPAIARLDDIQRWLERAPAGTGLVFDVEHFCLSEIVSEIADAFAGEFRVRPPGDGDLERAVHAAFLARTGRDWSGLERILAARLEATVALLAPHLDHLHVCGSDFVGFGDRDPRPGIGVYKGEHLPLRYAGLSADAAVQDRLPHEVWIRALGPHRPDVAVEISERPEFDSVKELERSCRFLEQAL